MSRRALVPVGLGVLLACLAGWVIVTAVQGSVDPVAVASLVVAVLALLGDLVALDRDRGGRTRTPVGTLADELARVLSEEWYAEAKARRLRDPSILPLSWTQSRPELADSPQSVTGSKNVTRMTLDGRLKGNFDSAVVQLAAAYRRIRSGRLVVLGEPGSGKSALALMLATGLLRDRPSGGAVPVLLPASSWDPLSESLDSWVVHSLAAAYYNGRREVPARLYEQDLVLPLVDGLDEMPEPSRRNAVGAINVALGTSRPAVVTCRSIEYEDLIEGGAPVLRRAPVVEVQPVAPEDLMTYLGDLDWPAGVDWTEVADHVRDQDAPVAEALSTPLMVSLVRTIYQRLGGDPGTLVKGFDSRHAVENHLTDRVVEAAYSTRPAPGVSKGHPEDPAAARRWLTFLALYLHRYGERELAWWRMSERLLSSWIAIVLGIAGGVVLMAAVGAWVALLPGAALVALDSVLTFSAIVGVIFAVLFVITWFSTAGRPPGRLALSAAGSASRLRRGFQAGVGLAALAGLPILVLVALAITLEDSWSLARFEPYLEGVFGVAVLAVVLGGALAVHSWLDAPPARASQASPAGFLRQDRRSALAGAAAAGLLVGLFAMPGVAIGMVAGSLISKLTSGGAGYPGGFDLGDLVRARFADVTTRPFHTVALAVGATVVLPAAMVAALVLVTRAWPRFVILRLVLRARRQLPWDLLRFLADARDRELIRRSAGAYQFRHVRLQERLANQTLLAGATASRPVGGQRVRRWQVAAAVVLVLVGLAAVEVPDDSSTVALTGAYGQGPYMPWISESGDYVAAASSVDSVDSADPAAPDVRVWSVPNGDLVSVIHGIKGPVDTIVFGRGDGLLLITTTPDDQSETPDNQSGQRTYLADTETGTVLRDVNGTGALAAGNRLLLQTFHPHAPALDSVELWDSSRPSSSDRSDGPAGPRRLLSPIPGHLVTTDESGGQTMPALPTFVIDRDSQLTIRSSADGTPLSAIPVARHNTDTFLLSPDGRWVYADGIGAWSTESGRPLPGPHEYTAMTAVTAITASGSTQDLVAATSGGRPDTAEDDHTVTLWSGSLDQPMTTLPKGPVGGTLEFVAGGRSLVSTDTDDTGSGTRIRSWSVAGRSVALDRDDLSGYAIADSGTDAELLGHVRKDPAGQLTLWSLTQPGPPIRTIRMPATRLNRAEPSVGALSRDGALAWVDSAGQGHLLPSDPRHPVSDLGDSINLDASRFSHDGTAFVAVTSDGVVDIRSAATGARVPELRPGDRRDRLGSGESLAFAALDTEARVLVTVSEQSELVMVRDPDTGDVIKKLSGHSGPIESLEFVSPRSYLMTSGVSDSSIRLWTIPMGPSR